MPTFDVVVPPANTGAGKQILHTSQSVAPFGASVAQHAVMVGQNDITLGTTTRQIGAEVALNALALDAIGVSGPLSALNAAVAVVMTGMRGASFVLTGGGNLVGTLVPEYSCDGGISWNIGYFFNAASVALIGIPPGGVAQGLAVNSPTATQLSILVPPGVSDVRVRASAFISGSSTAVMRSSQAGEGGIIFTRQLDGARATYSATALGLVLVTGATDVFTIIGSASKVVRVLEFVSTLTIDTAAQQVQVNLVKRSAADTGGTSTPTACVPHDSRNSVATAVVSQYTANPALGAAVGIIDAAMRFAPASGTPVLMEGPTIFDLTKGPAQNGVLNGVAETLCINLNAPANSGVGTFRVRWTEE